MSSLRAGNFRAAPIRVARGPKHKKRAASFKQSAPSLFRYFAKSPNNNTTPREDPPMYGLYYTGREFVKT
jgi:hypothetical protein